MDYLSSVRVLDTDYKIKDEEAARINHKHKIEEIEGAAKEGHKHQASEIGGLSAVATSGSYSDLEGKPSAATANAAGLMSAADKKKLDGIAAGAQTNAVTSVNGKTGTVKLGASDVGAASASHTHPASQVSGLSAVATSGKYADLAGAPSSVKNPSALTVQVNGETVATYDGSSAATANITPASIGAAPSSHTHPYLPLSGGTLTGNVTAPKFVGGLQGTADAAKTADRATTASRVAHAGPGTANVARHVWFSGSDDETARVYNDAFRYNPVGNMLSCNVSGSAATADSAASAAKLAKARTISLTGAVSGSAKFDGSGNVNISTTANESYISSPISGLFNMAVDADGNLWVYHSDSDEAPNFEYDSATGNLYYVTEA